MAPDPHGPEPDPLLTQASSSPDSTPLGGFHVEVSQLEEEGKPVPR